MVGVTGSIPVAPTRPDDAVTFIARDLTATRRRQRAADLLGIAVMKVRNSLKSLRARHRDNRIVRRKGRVYIINKSNPRFKARQG